LKRLDIWRLDLRRVLYAFQAASQLAEVKKPRMTATVSTTFDGPPSDKVEQFTEFQRAGVAELVDARDLKSLGPQGLCGFDSHPPHQILKELVRTDNGGADLFQLLGTNSDVSSACRGRAHEQLYR
jgi:hypothetical protein